MTDREKERMRALEKVAEAAKDLERDGMGMNGKISSAAHYNLDKLYYALSILAALSNPPEPGECPEVPELYDGVPEDHGHKPEPCKECGGTKWIAGRSFQGQAEDKPCPSCHAKDKP